MPGIALYSRGHEHTRDAELVHERTNKKEAMK